MWSISLIIKKMNMKTMYQIGKILNNDNNNHLDEEAGVDGDVNWYHLVGRQCASIYPSLKGAYPWKSMSTQVIY